MPAHNRMGSGMRFDRCSRASTKPGLPPLPVPLCVAMLIAAAVPAAARPHGTRVNASSPSPRLGVPAVTVVQRGTGTAADPLVVAVELQADRFQTQNLKVPGFQAWLGSL